MKAINFIRHLAPLAEGPMVEIMRRGETLYSKEINRENMICEFKALEKLCKKSDLTLSVFVVERNTLRIYVV